MQINVIPTDDLYRRMIATPDMETRRQIFREKLIAPWQSMMAMFSSGPDDEFAGARAWNWMLPEDLTHAPAALIKLEEANAWDTATAALTKAARCFEPYTDRIPFDSVTAWLIIADPARSDPIGRGYTGAIDFTQPQLVGQFDTPNDYNLPRLPGLFVHELHHLIRLEIFPWNMATTSVTDYIVHEGMAESFAAELFGPEVVGYYVTEFDDAQLETAKTLIAAGLDKIGFNVIRGYIFGDYHADKFGFHKIGMPAYGGYAIGYRVVQAYLQRTGHSVAEATFVSAAEIVAQSGYFAS